jgi:ParB family transcriptional regulator, chromosome partitioning protein
MSKRQPLTQGLSASLAQKFIADPSSVGDFHPEQFPSPQTVPLTKIQLPPKQPRRYFDPEKQQQLTDSIQQHGILEPLLLRKLSQDRYELVAGERRYRSAQALNLPEVPSVIKELTDKQALQISLIENLQRDDLNAIDETEAILELLSIEIDGTTEDVASVLHRANHAKTRGQELEGNVFLQFQRIEKVLAGVGRFSPESFRTSRLPLLNMPEDVLKILREGNLEFTKARVISRVKDEKQRLQLLKSATGKNLSLTQIKQEIALTKPPNTSQESEVPTTVRFTQVVKAVNQSKIWDDPKKRRKLDKLIAELEALLD